LTDENSPNPSLAHRRNGNVRIAYVLIYARAYQPFVVPAGNDSVGGLVIVQAPSTTFRPSPNTSDANDSSARQPSRPPTVHSHDEVPVAGPSQPPNKKFRAGSNPPSTSRGASHDVALEHDVRAMDDEAEHLRRNARVPTTIDSVKTPPGPSKSSRTKFVDRSASLPERETPTIQRNKQLREPSLNAIRQGSTSSEPSGQQNGHRRRGSMNGRGKRVSDLWENAGVICEFRILNAWFGSY
jgi:kinetochore protein Mis13/DSN1